MKIETLDELYEAAMNRRAVTVRGRGSRIPAAFVLSMQGMTIRGMLKRGMTVYEKNETTKERK